MTFQDFEEERRKGSGSYPELWESLVEIFLKKGIFFPDPFWDQAGTQAYI